jgi:hypothetical protein
VAGDGRGSSYASRTTTAVTSSRCPEPELVEAIGIDFSDTHTLAEGAARGAQRVRMEGRRVGPIMTGQNIDRPAMLAADSPS